MALSKQKISSWWGVVAGSVVVALIPVGAIASNYIPLAPLPGISQGGNADIGSYVSGGFTFAVAFAGLLAVVRIVWAGIKYMSTDAITGKKEGREIIAGAVYGLLLAIGSYMILRTVDPRLVNFNLTVGQSSLSSPAYSPAVDLNLASFQQQAPVLFQDPNSSLSLTNNFAPINIAIPPANTPTPVVNPPPPDPNPVPTGALVGKTVVTTASAAIYSQPSQSSTFVNTVSSGRTGSCTNGATDSSGEQWWYVNFGRGSTGWIQDRYVRESP